VGLVIYCVEHLLDLLLHLRPHVRELALSVIEEQQVL
jgi:hypothetical protein